MPSRTFAQRLHPLAAGLVLLLLAALTSTAQAVEVQRVVSPGGLEAWLVEDHANPILALSFSVEGGSALDPTGKEGLARMTAALLDEGAGPLDSQAFQGELERLSLRLSFSAGKDELSGELVALTEHRARGFELLALALNEPRFDEEPVERIRSQLMVRLKRQANDPNTLAADALERLLFPKHPYGRPSYGTEESLAAITREDLAGYAATRLARGTLKIGVVGDVTPEELGSLLDQAFGPLPAEGAPVEIVEVTPREGAYALIERNLPQTVLLLAQPGPKRDDPDFYAANVVNYILGGSSFSSRLYEEVREKRGLAYTVWSSLSPRQHSGLWYAGTATQSARAGESYAVIREVWERLAKEGPTAKEVENAVTYLTGSFPLSLTSSDGIAEILVAMQRENLGIDYLDKRNDFYNALTVEEVQRVAREWLDAAKLSIAVVGNPADIAPPGVKP